jgi:hypothetical protein
MLAERLRRKMVKADIVHILDSNGHRRPRLTYGEHTDNGPMESMQSRGSSTCKSPEVAKNTELKGDSAVLGPLLQSCQQILCIQSYPESFISLGHTTKCGVLRERLQHSNNSTLQTAVVSFAQKTITVHSSQCGPRGLVSPHPHFFISALWKLPLSLPQETHVPSRVRAQPNEGRLLLQLSLLHTCQEGTANPMVTMLTRGTASGSSPPSDT